MLASAGHADPGKEGFREDSQVGQIQHAFAHPNGWAGEFNVLRTDRRAREMMLMMLTFWLALTSRLVD